MRLSSEKELKMMKGHEKTGRPLGSNSFIDKIEHAVGRVLRPSKTRTQKEETQQLGILSPELARTNHLKFNKLPIVGRVSGSVTRPTIGNFPRTQTPVWKCIFEIPFRV